MQKVYKFLLSDKRKVNVLLGGILFLICLFVYIPEAKSNVINSKHYIDENPIYNGTLLVRTFPVNDHLQLKDSVPLPVLYKISTPKGEMMKSGMTENGYINVKGLIKGTYIIEISIDGIVLKQQFSILI